jgi:L-aspartate oxidase
MHTSSISFSASDTRYSQWDVLIVGTGLAGLVAALSLADYGRVAILSKRQLEAGASNWAQGGIAAVMSSDDSIEQHVEDTLVAGAGLCDRKATEFIVGQSHAAMDWLIQQGVEFTRQEDDSLHFTKEGGHSVRRILHVADATGHAVQKTMMERAKKHPNIFIFEHHLAIDLITHRHALEVSNATSICYGAYVWNDSQHRVETFLARSTILATGGAGKVYLYTTNPDTSTGDGIAMAWRAGCDVANMEFIQFHPTCLFHPHAKSFLISEAVRGEGGILRIPDTGHRFMFDHDPRGELASRDIVARSIDFEMKKRGLDYVHLDMTHCSEMFIREHFPTIYQKCLAFGMDMARVPLPVVPAAHYTCGGVVTDLDGQTTISHLYAIGETACTGLHGANRLASNSLLECVVLAQSAARSIRESWPDTIQTAIPAWDESRVTDADEEVVIAHNWEELRRCMWNYVGIVRTTKRLERAEHRIRLLRSEIFEFYSHFRVSYDLIELRNLVDVADLIVRSALQRKESRGLHFSRDYPFTLEEAKPTVLKGYVEER